MVTTAVAGTSVSESTALGAVALQLIVEAAGCEA
jgi:hypothetical protein